MYTTMIPQDKTIVEKWKTMQNRPPTFILASNQDPPGLSLIEFCDALQALLPELKIKKDTDEPFQAPALIVGRNQNVAFQALPAGKILEPFLEAISTADTPSKPLPEKIASRLEQLSHPMQLKLYIAQQCPHCPQVVKKLLPLVQATALARLTIIDAQLFLDKSKGDQIRSVPTLILDDCFRWTGQVDLAEILELGVKRDPSAMSADSLKQILEAGEAPRAAGMMIEQATIFPALVDLLIHPRWSVRLGAMVTAEYLAEETPDLVAELAQILWRRFDRLPAQTQGDVVHVIGLLKSDATQNYLKSITAGDYDQEVIEAAREALE
jgi:hypothetical protein